MTNKRDPARPAGVLAFRLVKLDASLQGSSQGKRDLNFNIEVGKPRLLDDGDRKLLVATCRIKVDNPDSPIRLDAAYEAAFVVDKADTDPAKYEHFIEKSLAFMVWPYLRNLVHETTSRMLIPPIVLPFVLPQDIATGLPNKAASGA